MEVPLPGDQLRYPDALNVTDERGENDGKKDGSINQQNYVPQHVTRNEGNHDGKRNQI